MKRVILPIGPQYAGKSTFCQKVATHFPEVAYISRDKILIELFGTVWLSHYDGGHFAGLKKMWEQVSELFERSDFTLILDTWNGPTRDRIEIVNKLRELGATNIVGWHFVTPLDACIEWSFIRDPCKITPGKRSSEISRSMRISQYTGIHEAFLNLSIEKEGLFDSIKQIDATKTMPEHAIEALV